MIGGGIRQRARRIGLTAGALALLFQLFAWTLTMPATFAPLNEIAVCTAEGLVHLDVEGPPSGAELPTEHPAKHPDGGSCPLCPLVGGLHLPPPLHLVSQDAVTRHSPVALPGALILTGWFLSTLQARAPPA
ncbi:DUF2946 family protein [Azospirillum doebereinerae]|uniref:DUF2946 family protein n=1 Tax=Azospirillum doebereinerae TaxID=92933 RepID=UPI001EE54BF7|nr:DUF2946 family protein [Azospirillum doebereinerae]MCG5238724.1 DUF2946 family protein [Azospirillum doebereinerae]